jgi:protein-disulfide isomerase
VKAGATSTPTFYIEGGLLVGSWPPEVWRPILDSVFRVKSARKP